MGDQALDPAALAARLVAALGSQDKLAERLRVSQPTVSRWIAGIHRPSWGEVVAMEGILAQHDNAKYSC